MYPTYSLIILIMFMFADKDEEFDWASYLLEGEEPTARYYDDSPVSN